MLSALLSTHQSHIFRNKSGGFRTSEKGVNLRGAPTAFARGDGYIIGDFKGDRKGRLASHGRGL